MPAENAVGVLGARSLVGRPLLRMLVESGRGVLAGSRKSPAETATVGIEWFRPEGSLPAARRWVALCPLWATRDAWDRLAASGVERLVALSSTSVLTKLASPDPADRRLAGRLAAAEDELVGRAGAAGVGLVIIRPTMIYDGHSDGNVAEIAAWVSRWGWFPVSGAARGLRQPVHADDVATACLAALDHPAPRPVYTLSGGEPLPFRDLVKRTCRAHGLPPRVVTLPRWIWTTLAWGSRALGAVPAASAGSGSRMNEDLLFDHSPAAADLGFRPRPFTPAAGRLGSAAGSRDSAAGQAPEAR